MNFLALSLVSLKGIMILGRWENQTPRIMFFDEWSSSENTGLSSDILSSWERLRQKSGSSLTPDQIQEIFVISGPGSFTGIRVGAAFAAGMAAGLGVKAYSLSTYDLFDRSVGIPVRTHLAAKTPSQECAALGIEFLFQQSETHQIECRLPVCGDTLLGVLDADDELKNWPTIEQFQRALSTSAHKRLPLTPEYGISPKIFGKRA